MNTRPSRRTLLLATTAIAIGSLTACASLFGPRTVEISRDELQAKLARKFPLTRNVLNMFDVTASSPRLAMIADTNRVSATVDLLARDTIIRRDYLGTVSVSFGLRYEPSDLTLRILALNVDGIRIEGMPQSFQQMLLELGNRVAREHLQDYPIHQFKPEDVGTVSRMGLQVDDIQVTKTGLAVHLKPAR